MKHEKTREYPQENTDKYKLHSCLNTGELHSSGKLELVNALLLTPYNVNLRWKHHVPVNFYLIVQGTTIILERNSAPGFSCC